jgi:hypothetical protein
MISHLVIAIRNIFVYNMTAKYYNKIPLLVAKTKCFVSQSLLDICVKNISAMTVWWADGAEMVTI